MSSTFGNVLHLSIFGQSHSPAIGCSLDGIPAGIAVDQEKLQAFLDRRAPGRDETATKRREATPPTSSPVLSMDIPPARPSPRLSRTPTRAPMITPSCAASPVPDMRTSLRA